MTAPSSSSSLLLTLCAVCLMVVVVSVAADQQDVVDETNWHERVARTGPTTAHMHPVFDPRNVRHATNPYN
jgi:hypothetical protein